jgi:hypothetical protein
MWPTIRPPARVLVTTADRPHLGEIWAFVGADGQIVVHRCLGRRGGGYAFKGDGLPARDPIVPPSTLVGRVVAIDDERGHRRLRRRDVLVSQVRLLLSRGAAALRRLARWAGRPITGRGRVR